MLDWVELFILKRVALWRGCSLDEADYWLRSQSVHARIWSGLRALTSPK